MAYENYTIRQFENAMFKDDRSVMDDEEYNIVYNEYIDTAKLYETEEFQKVSYITYLNGRINTMKLAIRLQREFYNNFQEPYQPGFKKIKEKGYSLYWNRNNPEEFIKQLDRIETSEKRYISEVENCVKQLIDFRAKRNTKEQPVKIKRELWIRNINTLNKLGYKIDRDKETVEDLSIMILQQTES